MAGRLAHNPGSSSVASFTTCAAGRCRLGAGAAGRPRRSSGAQRWCATLVRNLRHVKAPRCADTGGTDHQRLQAIVKLQVELIAPLFAIRRSFQRARHPTDAARQPGFNAASSIESRTYILSALVLITKLGRYDIIKPLNKGGMALVCEGHAIRALTVV